MKQYIANRPVRFDRNYTVGEIIPDAVIEPKMAKKLTDMGRILCVDVPEAASGTEDAGKETQPDIQNEASASADAEFLNPPQEDAEAVPDSENGAEGTNTQADAENAPDGESGAMEGGLETAGDGKDTDVPATEECICEICGKTFKSQQGLAAHSRTHKN